MGSLSVFTDRDDLSDSHLWLSQCRDRRIPKDIQSKCMLYQKLRNMGVDNPNLVDEASRLTNFTSLNPSLLAFVIWLQTNRISLNVKTNNIMYNGDSGPQKFDNFFDSDQYFGPSSNINLAGYKYTKDNLKDFKISVYRYMRLWAFR